MFNINILRYCAIDSTQWASADRQRPPQQHVLVQLRALVVPVSSGAAAAHCGLLPNRGMPSDA